MILILNSSADWKSIASEHRDTDADEKKKIHGLKFHVKISVICWDLVETLKSSAVSADL